MYAIAVMANGTLIKNEEINPNVIRITDVARTGIGPIIPAAMGLFFLIECTRSWSASRKSFIRYIATEIQVKIRNAEMARPTKIAVPERPAVSHHKFILKNSGIRTSPFFSDCLGRDDIIRPFKLLIT